MCNTVQTVSDNDSLCIGNLAAVWLTERSCECPERLMYEPMIAAVEEICGDSVTVRWFYPKQRRCKPGPAWTSYWKKDTKRLGQTCLPWTDKVHRDDLIHFGFTFTSGSTEEGKLLTTTRTELKKLWKSGPSLS